MSKPLMQCGHAANAIDVQGKPVCAICIGVDNGATLVADKQPSLEGRQARCCYGCGNVVPSSLGLAFFEHRPGMQFDSYYCGCKGWD